MPRSRELANLVAAGVLIGLGSASLSVLVSMASPQRGLRIARAGQGVSKLLASSSGR